MSETTNTPEPEDLQGTFVGGTFGVTSTELQEQDTEGADAFSAVEGTEGEGADVEGVSSDVPPGQRNEPV